MLTTFALILAQAQVADAALTTEPKPIPSLSEATTQIAEIDTELFYYAFEACDAAKVRVLITDDFRMVHDEAGLVADSGDTFAAALDAGCKDRAPGGKTPAYKNRRVLVPGTETVTPLGEWGVLHRGAHIFQEWRAQAQSWETVGGARFLNIYQWIAQEGAFRMQETISVDHGSARPLRPGS